MPNNIAGRGLTDREMVQLCLELEKARCRSLSNTILETSHQQFREIFKQCLDVSLHNQHRLFKLMKKRGWYNVQTATTAQIGQTQELIQNNLHPDNQF
jgi:spore coat protein CotF